MVFRIDPSLDLGNFERQELDTNCSSCLGSAHTIALYNPTHHHGSDTCNDCYRDWIDTQIANPDLRWNQIHCPECSELLPYEIIRAMASQSQFEKLVLSRYTVHPRQF